MELLLTLAFFLLAMRFLRRSLELPTMWAMGAAGVAALIVYPAIAYALSSSTAALIATPVCIPLLVPIALLLSGMAGFVVGRGLLKGSGPFNPF